MSSHPSPAEPSFSDFELAPDVLEALTRMGIVRPTPIQQAVIGPILKGKDVIGKAETGTGKTIGFGSPLVGKIDTTRVAVQALVITPTRELAQQVAGVMEILGEGRNLKVALVVGGVHASEQVVKLRAGSQVVVGTPGRVLDFLGDRTLSLVWAETVVVDEADRLFDMGFIDDLRKILDHLPEERQTLLFSATIPPGIKDLMEKYMKDPETYSTAKGLSTVSEIRQVYREVEFNRKFDELKKILDANPEDTCIIFINTRHQAKDLDRMLWGHNYPAGALHGDHDQEKRFKTLEAFRSREIRILVATDVASRGLDIEDVGLVINYEVPVDTDSYVHRIGRTGRASKTGVAITLVARKEVQGWNRIIQATKFKVEREDPATGRRRGRPRPVSPAPSASRGRGGDESRSGRRPRRRGGRGRGGSRDEKAARTGGAATGGERESAAATGGERESAAAAGGERESAAAAGGERRPAAAASDERARASKSDPAAKSTESQKSRGRRSRRGRGGREGGESPSHKPRDTARAPVEPVESVDLFDVSMKDFLDVSRPIDDFVAERRPRTPPPEISDEESSPARPGAPRSEAKSDSPESGSEAPRKRRRRRRGGRPDSGASARDGAEGGTASGAGKPAAGGAGKSAASAAEGEPKRRRRRRRGGRKRGSESAGASSEGGDGTPVSKEEAS